MKNIIKTMVFLVSCTWLCGCQNSELTDLDRLFAQKPVIELPIQLSNIQSDDIGMPIYFASVDSFLVVSEMFNNNFIAVYNTNSGKLVNRFASKGQGPNEFLGVGGLYFLNDQLLIHGTMPNRMVYVNKGDLLESDISFRTVGFKEGEYIAHYLKIAPVSDGLFMGTAMFTNYDKKEQFAIADGNGEFLREFDQYPLNEELKSVANYDLTYGFQGTIQPSPDGRHALYFGVLHGVLKFFRFDSDNPVKIKEYVAAYPKFISQAIPNEKRYGVIVSNESIAGAISVAVSDDSYYVLFSDQPRVYKSQIIYVFDFDGEPVKKILLDEPVNSIVYSRKDNSLWAYREMTEAPRIDFIRLR
jgi:hypothetical protein